MNYRVVSLAISAGKYKGFVDNAIKLGTNSISSYVCVANVHMCIEAYDNADFARIVNQADLVTPDGMPLAKAIKLLYGVEQDRVAGMDLLPDLLAEAEKENLKCFVYGGSEKMLANSEAYIQEHYPNLQCGFHSPPFRALTTEEELADCDRINNFGAHLVFVALGCPKQEKWMAKMKGRIHACMLGIGGALPVMIGMQDRAPAWMQKASLEWLYRLGQEPKRLFKRYAYTNSKFIYLLMKQKLGLLK
ncbi:MULTISPECIES: WecB/TagA/CpsF family glycosyltransferase [Sphingobacterium]|uniref:WecB/TagA/CpsF family glycosyltransferase n=1 Tax=Sphingobacterium populi TaxID=1812824 RepID=A0ABW5UDY2_9SPHI|nr:WecB/TagA/CpsF family glycosyltransferase [Sphingobacterium sp. CFCC 11742]